MSVFDDYGVDGPETTFAERLEDALNDICEAWQVDAEGRELVERLRVAAARLGRRKNLPPRPIRDVLWRAEAAPNELGVLAKCHAPALPVERWFRREMLASRVPEELDIPLLISFLRKHQNDARPPRRGDAGVGGPIRSRPRADADGRGGRGSVATVPAALRPAARAGQMSRRRSSTRSRVLRSSTPTGRRGSTNARLFTLARHTRVAGRPPAGNASPADVEPVTQPPRVG